MTPPLHLPRPRALLALAVLALALALAALAAWPAAGPAAGRTETLRFFSEDVSLTLTRADGSVVRRPPLPAAAPGDVLDVKTPLSRGDHRPHGRPTATAHLRCTFGATPEPDCLSHVAIGGSLLVFQGAPGTLVNGTGRFQGATGRVVKNREVPGGSDVVARIRLRSR